MEPIVHNAATRSSGCRCGGRPTGLRRHAIRRIDTVFGILVCLLMAMTVTLTPFGTAANAASATNGSLTISARGGVDASGGHPLVGDTYAVAYVAGITLNDDGTGISGFTTRAPFKRFDREWGELTSSQANAAAKEIADYAGKHGRYDYTDRRTGGDGTVTISGLAPGLYLVNRVGVADANRKYRCDPFFVTIPEFDAGVPDYQVTAAPKFEELPVPPGPTTTPEPGATPTPTPTAPETPGRSDIAKTGAAIMRYVEAAVILGAIAFAAMFIHTQLRRRD